MNSPINKYFANKPADELVSECDGLVRQYGINSWIWQIWRKNSYIYYQNVIGDPLSFSGTRGEMTTMSVPKSRKLVRDYLSIVNKQKLKFKSVMKNNEYTNWVDGKIADALAEHIIKTENLENKRDKLGEGTFVLGQGFLWVYWDQFRGNKVMNPETGVEERSGKATIKYKAVNEIFYYQSSGNQWDDVQWCVVRDTVNKYDLAAEHPEMADKIESVNNFNDYSNDLDIYFNYTRPDESIYLYHFYHKPTPAVPQGRMVIYASADCVVYDGPNVYECIPLFSCMPETISNSVLGYPQFCNLTALQEMLDHNYGVIASNQSVWGVQSMLNPRGSDIDVRQLFGLNFIDFTPAGPDGGGEPKPLQYPQTPSEIFAQLDRYDSKIDDIGGINSALRGQAPQGVTAASAIATLTANALEFISTFSRSLHDTVTDAVSFAAKLYFAFGAEEQFIDVIDTNVAIQKQYNRNSLQSLDKFNLELSNPLLNSYSYNLQSAETLLSQGLIQDPKTYFRVLEGDRTSVMYNDDLQEEMCIQQENDDLQKGIPAQVLYYDNDDLHILHHKTLLMNPNIRRNLQPEILQGILQHLQEHEQQKMMKMGPQLPPLGAEGQPQGQPQQGQLPPPNQEPQPAQPAKPAEAPISL